MILTTTSLDTQIAVKEMNGTMIAKSANHHATRVRETINSADFHALKLFIDFMKNARDVLRHEEMVDSLAIRTMTAMMVIT